MFGIAVLSVPAYHFIQHLRSTKDIKRDPLQKTVLAISGRKVVENFDDSQDERLLEKSNILEIEKAMAPLFSKYLPSTYTPCVASPVTLMDRYHNILNGITKSISVAKTMEMTDQVIDDVSAMFLALLYFAMKTYFTFKANMSSDDSVIESVTLPLNEVSTLVCMHIFGSVLPSNEQRPPYVKFILDSVKFDAFKYMISQGLITQADYDLINQNPTVYRDNDEVKQRIASRILTGCETIEFTIPYKLFTRLIVGFAFMVSTRMDDGNFNACIMPFGFR
jgi:hypothetical protein